MLKFPVPHEGTVRDPRGLLQTIVECDGYYNAVINDRLLGPVVGYAGKYETPSGEQNYVGYEYFNFAKVEEKPVQLRKFAGCLREELHNHHDWDIDAIVAAPMGGLSLASMTALLIEADYYYPEKKVLEVGTDGRRDKTELQWDRHALPSGLRVAIMEDVINNKSTTGTMIDLIESRGSQVVVILCGLLRAATSEYVHHDRHIQIGSAIHRITAQFKQENPAVSNSISSGDVEWKAKDHWDDLQEELQRRHLRYQSSMCSST